MSSTPPIHLNCELDHALFGMSRHRQVSSLNLLELYNADRRHAVSSQYFYSCKVNLSPVSGSICLAEGEMAMKRLFNLILIYHWLNWSGANTYSEWEYTKFTIAAAHQKDLRHNTDTFFNKLSIKWLFYNQKLFHNSRVDVLRRQWEKLLFIFAWTNYTNTKLLSQKYSNARHIRHQLQYKFYMLMLVFFLF